MTFRDDDESVVDIYYAELKNGKVAIKFDPDASYYRLISKKKFDTMKKQAIECNKLVESTTFSL